MSNENNGDKARNQVAQVMGRTKGTLSETVEKIKARVNGVNDQAATVSNRILARTKTKDVDTSEKILTEAVLALEDMLPKSITKGFFEKFVEKIPFAKKMKDNIEKTVVDNITAEEAVNRVFGSVETAIEHMSSDLSDLDDLTHTLDDSTAECQVLEEEIQREIETLEKDPSRRMELITLRNLMREVSSIKIVNAKTANSINMQFNASEALSTKLSEIKPLLKSMLASQLALASQVSKNKRVQEISEGLSNLINTMIVDQDARSQDTLQETIRLAHTPVIKEKTLIDLATQHEKAKKEMVKLVQDISSNNQKYLEVQRKTEQSLKNGDIKQIAMEIVDKEEKKKQENKPQGE